jgi:hypothetical protein
MNLLVQNWLKEELLEFFECGPFEQHLSPLEARRVPMIASTPPLPMLPGEVGRKEVRPIRPVQSQYLQSRIAPNLMRRVLDEKFRLQPMNLEICKAYDPMARKIEKLQAAVSTFDGELMKEALNEMIQQENVESLASYIILFGLENTLVFEVLLNLEEYLDYVETHFSAQETFDEVVAHFRGLMNEAIALRYYIAAFSAPETDLATLHEMMKLVHDYGYEELYYAALKNQEEIEVRDEVLLRLGQAIKGWSVVIHTRELLKLTEEGQLTSICSEEAVNQFKAGLDEETRRYLNLREVKQELALLEEQEDQRKEDDRDRFKIGMSIDLIARQEWDEVVKIRAPAVSPLIDVLAGEDLGMRSKAALALGQIGSVRAVGVLIDALGDRNVRCAAAKALGEIGDTRAVEALIGALGDEEADVRGVAAGALGNIGDAQAVEGLIRALRYGDRFMRRDVAEILVNIGDARAVEALTGALGDENGDVRDATAEALSKIRVAGIVANREQRH